MLEIAKVSAPTLYHHFGNADGILSAALAKAFAQFLQSKQQAARKSADPVTALVLGWGDYVQFAAARPRLYAAMLSRVLQGGQIPAAEQAFDLLLDQLRAVAAVLGQRRDSSRYREGPGSTDIPKTCPSDQCVDAISRPSLNGRQQTSKMTA